MKRLFLLCAAIAISAAGASWAASGETAQGDATAAIRETTDKILAVVKDEALKQPGMEGEKRTQIRKIADERFAWAEMAKRSMGRNWAKMSDSQKQEFVPLFTNLVYQAYMDKVADYKGEKIVYRGEETEDIVSTVSVAIVTEKNTEIPVRYRMTKSDGRWLIYDVSIEGVSLVNNYRMQFSDFLSSGTIDKLIARLKEKAGNDSPAAPAS